MAVEFRVFWSSLRSFCTGWPRWSRCALMAARRPRHTLGKPAQCKPGGTDLWPSGMGQGFSTSFKASIIKIWSLLGLGRPCHYVWPNTQTFQMSLWGAEWSMTEVVLIWPFGPIFDRLQQLNRVDVWQHITGRHQIAVNFTGSSSGSTVEPTPQIWQVWYGNVWY